jgi:rRNA maturation endonuclease Nob1
MKLVVHDTSILIDLALSRTAEAWFAAGIETWTTDLVYPREIDDEDQRALFASYVKSGHLKIRQFDETEIEESWRFQAKVGRRGLSITDISVFRLTQQLGPEAVLATGDKALRALATREKVMACGFLRLFRYMVMGVPGGRPPVLPKEVAIERLKLLMAHPECRLPVAKCEELLRQWGGSL